jgi:hypothetical protein
MSCPVRRRSLSSASFLRLRALCSASASSPSLGAKEALLWALRGPESNLDERLNCLHAHWNWCLGNLDFLLLKKRSLLPRRGCTVDHLKAFATSPSYAQVLLLDLSRLAVAAGLRDHHFDAFCVDPRGVVADVDGVVFPIQPDIGDVRLLPQGSLDGSGASQAVNASKLERAISQERWW